MPTSFQHRATSENACLPCLQASRNDRNLKPTRTFSGSEQRTETQADQWYLFFGIEQTRTSTFFSELSNDKRKFKPASTFFQGFSRVGSGQGEPPGPTHEIRIPSDPTRMNPSDSEHLSTRSNVTDPRDFENILTPTRPSSSSFPAKSTPCVFVLADDVEQQTVAPPSPPVRFFLHRAKGTDTKAYQGCVFSASSHEHIISQAYHGPGSSNVHTEMYAYLFSASSN